MKAIVYDEYGPPNVLQVREMEKPIPGDNEVLIKVYTTSVTKYDCWVRSCTAPPGFDLLMRIASGKKPKHPVLGTELAGEVEAVGKDVIRFKPGDNVFGFTGMNMGAYAEYICLPETAVAKKPENVTSEEAAAAPQGALTALFFLRQANLQRGEKVLIFGASGGVGGYAVQLAKHHFGADVAGVCSTAKMEFVKSLGADRVIDYTKEDFTRNGQVYDVIFDTVGKTSVSRSKQSLQKEGTYLLATFGLGMLFQLLWISITSHCKVCYGSLKETTEDLIYLGDLLETGVIKPVIDRTYPLEQTAEAHKYVESGQKTGNVIITVS